MSIQSKFVECFFFLPYYHIVKWVIHFSLHSLIQIHYFKDLLSNYCVLNTKANAKNKAVREHDPRLHEACYLVIKSLRCKN